MRPAKPINAALNGNRPARVIQLPSDPVQKIHTYPGNSDYPNAELFIHGALCIRWVAQTTGLLGTGVIVQIERGCGAKRPAAERDDKQETNLRRFMTIPSVEDSVSTLP